MGTLHRAHHGTRPPSGAPRRTLFPCEHRQTELVRPGARPMDLGDGINPFLLRAQCASAEGALIRPTSSQPFS